MNVRPLSPEDLRPYTIPSKVIAVRLFRRKKGIWLAGIRKELDLNDESVRICFIKFIQIEPKPKLNPDSYDPSEKLFACFGVMKSGISFNGIQGNDQRPLECSDPQLIEFANPSTDVVVSIKSNEHGAMILSSREEDLRDLNQLFNQLQHVTEKIAVAH